MENNCKIQFVENVIENNLILDVFSISVMNGEEWAEIIIPFSINDRDTIQYKKFKRVFDLTK